jgi:glycosyltransferase involved in cell wall biosynthesis
LEREKFCIIDNPENNFTKLRNINSDLIWGECSSKDILISIVVITYKREKLVKEALESIFNQKSVDYNWEIVLMDNDPNNKDLVEYVKKINNTRLRYYRNRQNLGHEGNINRGVELSHGKWVALLHDDDLLAPDYLMLIKQYIDACSKWKKPLAYVRAEHISFTDKAELPVYINDRNIENRFLIKRELWTETLLKGNGPTFVNSCGSLILKSAFIEIGGYNEKLNPIGDSTLGLIFMKHGYSVYVTKRALGYYRQGQNLSVKKDTLISLIDADYSLREYLYLQNIWTRMFGKIFREVQFVESADIKLYHSAKFQQNDCEEVLSLEDINKIHEYKPNKALRALLRILRGIMCIVYRQSGLRRLLPCTKNNK